MFGRLPLTLLVMLTNPDFSFCRTRKEIEALFDTDDALQTSQSLLIENMRQGGWDIEGRLYLGFSPMRVVVVDAVKQD